MRSSIKHLTTLQKIGGTETARRDSKVVLGLWNHGGVGKRVLGEFDFGLGAGMDMHQEIIRWFDYWLKGMDNGVDAIPAVRYYVIGSGKWKESASWPPSGYEPFSYFLDAGKDGSADPPSLALTPEPASQESQAGYMYDPHDPVPTLWGRDFYSLPGNRRRLYHRPDILRYRTDALTRCLEVAGEAKVNLYVASSTRDTDFFARLVDEDPDGPALEISYGMVRARHRNGLDREDFLVEGQVTEIEIDLGPTACCFLPGHRLMLEITSSDFPSHDRNHYTGENDLFDSRLEITQVTLHHAPAYPSRLVLPLAN